MDRTKAGRQLDELVAERVMGWKRGRTFGNGNGEWIIDGKGYDYHHISWEVTPKYSTDIAAAWEVLEKVASENWLISIERAVNLGKITGISSGLGWKPSFFASAQWPLKRDRREGCVINAPTAPLAICRMSLKIMQQFENPNHGRKFIVGGKTDAEASNLRH